MASPDSSPADAGARDFAGIVAGIVEQHADQIAVADAGSRLTYRELDRWSDAVAAVLLDAVGPGKDPVLVLGGHEVPAVVAFLAVAKCARPAVMLDSTTPVGRMQSIAEGAVPSAILYAESQHARVVELGAVAGTAILIPERPAADVPRFARLPVGDEDPLSIVFTSGSTGRPKGVIIGSIALMGGLRSALSMSGGERVICPVPLGFVFGLGLMVRALASGSEFHVHDPRVLGVDSLAERLDRDRITEFGSTPYIIRSLAQVAPGRVFASIHRVTLGGEAALTNDVRLIRAMTGDDCTVMNQLGSTEAWGVSSLAMPRDYVLPDQTFLPVGRPAPGREVTLIGDDGEIVTEPQTPGVIHLTAEHMSSGYWREPEATAARFTTHADGRRTYNTGDIGRWDADGQLEYVGRADNMVKVRGYLVEPAEVESHIRAEGEVRDVVVVGRPSPRQDGTTSLVAYVVPEPTVWVSGAAIRRRLAAELPSYMVPAQVVELTELPRNPNGKTDRLRLPEPPPPPAPPRVRKYEYEEAIADVAATALGLETVGVDDDLFELGLDSLAVEEMVAILAEQLDLQISSATIMENPTAAQLARVPRGDASHLQDGILTRIAAGQGTPIFAISGAGGLAMQLRELAQQLGTGRPVYGIQARGLEGGGLPDVTVGAMARRYLRTIRRLQPTGPFVILGHSLGSLVAFEVARRLTDAGETVSYLGLLDPPHRAMLESAASRPQLQRMTESGDSPLGRARARFTMRYPFATRSFWRSAKGDGRFHAWFEAGGSAAQRYRLRRPLALGGVYIYLVEGAPSTAATWFTPAATVIRVPGDHLSMLQRPFVSELAAEATAHIEAADSAPEQGPGTRRQPIP